MIDGELVDRTVREVLSRPGYAGLREGVFARFRERVQTWVLARLAELFDGPGGSVLGWVLIVLLVGLAAALTIRFVTGVRGGARRDEGDGVVVERLRSPADWLEAAVAARRAGDTIEAVRCGYRALVASFAARGLVEEVPGRTVGEYQRALVGSGSPTDRETFAAASAVFERAWYALESVDDDEVDLVLAAARGGAP